MSRRRTCLVFEFSVRYLLYIGQGLRRWCVWRRRLLYSWDILGEGSFGVFYEGEYRKQPVAIKKLRGVTNDAVGSFFREASVMLSLPPHENLVRMIGMCQQQSSFSLVMELVRGGSLVDYVAKNHPIGDSEAKRLCRGIAAGMSCLVAQKIVHRDLAARNVLLTETAEPKKVSDFGFSRVVGDDGIGKTVTLVGPIRWMPPEALSEHSFSEKSDVWSFGCLMIELLTNKPPFAELDIFKVAVLVRDEGYSPTIPPSVPHWAGQVMAACFRREPENRPRFRDIVDMLR